MQIGKVEGRRGENTLIFGIMGEIIGSLAGKWEENILFWKGKGEIEKLPILKNFPEKE